jgi:4-amino-4-deoxy-L-arabinose transferase-like glycosyltransferase
MKQRILRDKEWSAGIAGLAITSGLLTLWKLQDVSRSEYYAAIARSMSINFRNFFFGAIDPAGTVTLDKIPGSYWVPALFARIFGFSTWAITAPNALATVALVVVVAITSKMVFGRTAGLLAGAIVATTPIVIAVSRSNQPQSFFLLTLAIAGFFAAKALMQSSRKYLIISGAWIALAFHTYMLEAWALWPALIIAWFFTTGTFRKKITDLLIAGSISLALSLTWIVTVALIPASHRPFVGGTYHNNPFEMVFGYNGLGRFTATTSALSSATDDPTFRSFTPPFGGSAGIGRIFSTAVAGQIAWLIPAAVTAIVILAQLRVSKSIVVFFSIWLATFFAMFSAVAGIHQFYTSSLAIPVAVLSAGAVALAVKEAKHWHIVALLNVAGLSALLFTAHYGNYMKWATYAQVAIILTSVLLLFSERQPLRKFAIPALVLTGIIFTPAAWAADVRNHTNSINPVAGEDGFGGMRGGPGSNGAPGGKFPAGGFPPQGGKFPAGGFPPQGGKFPAGGFPPQGGKQPAGGMNFGEQDNSELLSYLKAHRNGAKFLLVTFGAQSAASFITATGENVLPVGGFDGQDPTPTLAVFKKLVASGEVRYVLAGSNAGGRNGDTQASSEISTWVSTNCSIDANAPSTSLYLCSNK